MSNNADTNKRISRKKKSLKINISFRLLMILFSSTSLPFFDDVSGIVNCFKPSIVYQCRSPLPLPTSDPALDPILYVPRRSARTS